MKAGRTTDIARIIPLLGAFVGAAVILGVLGAGLIMPTVGTIGAVTRTGVDMFDALPSEFTAPTLSQQSTILDAKGGVIAKPYDQNRIIVPLASVAPIMQKAQVAIEDDRFYEHGGVDVRGLVRAVVSNASNETVQGGSTLTQQYVKLMLQESAIQAGDTEAAQAAVARSGLAGVTRKLQEVKYSVQLEKVKTKDQILESYLNVVYYGDQAYGVEAASRHYFGGKSAKDLTLPEAALLAGLAQSPGSTDPVHFPDRAVARRDVVLDRMHELGLVTDKEWTDAKAVKLADMLKVVPAASACQAAGDTAYFCDYVIKWLETDPSLDQALGKTLQERKDKIYGGGLTIQTTIDPDISKIAKEEIAKKVPQTNQYAIGAAAVSLDPATGAVKGMAQSSAYSMAPTQFGQTQVNWSVDKQYGGSGGFQFGSTEKAFALVTALNQGRTANSTVNAKMAGPGLTVSYDHTDFPDACGIGRGQKWEPVKNDGLEGGVMSLRQATAQSVNTAFIALVSQLGACNVRDTEVAMGLHRADGAPWVAFPPAIILGANEVSPMTVASAYGSLGNNGVHCTPMPIQQITGPDGKELPIVKPGTTNCSPVVDKEVAHGVADIMTSVLQPGGTGKDSALANGRIAAGKTGTSNKNNETWFVGYTPQLSTAVWTGTPLDNNLSLDNITLNGKKYGTVFGASISAPVWKQIMDRALAGQPNVGFPAPSDKIVNGDKVSISGVSGMTIANATAQLTNQGFTVTVGRRVYSNYPVGTVAYTSAAGGQANRGTAVTLYISAGPAPKPVQTVQPTQPVPPAVNPPPAAGSPP